MNIDDQAEHAILTDSRHCNRYTVGLLAVLIIALIFTLWGLS